MRLAYSPNAFTRTDPGSLVHRQNPVRAMITGRKRPLRDRERPRGG